VVEDDVAWCEFVAEDGAVSPNVEQSRDATTVGTKEQAVETRASLWPKPMIVARSVDSRFKSRMVNTMAELRLTVKIPRDSIAWQ
jgi:hypothetical protein